MQQLKIRYADVKGRFAAERTIGEEDLIDAIDTSLGAVKTFLPEGIWQMEILSANRRIVKTAKITVRKDLPVKIIIRN